MIVRPRVDGVYGARDVTGGHGDPAQKGASKSPSKHRRLASLDVMRGLTMAAMIAADDIDQTTKEDKIQCVLIAVI